MIRFVDIRNQGTGNNFSFWDTCTDKYICIATYQAWLSWKELIDCVPFHVGNIDLDRLKGLCPKWVFDEVEDE